ncbi:AEC family transporter [Thermomonas mangrovi]|uniref:AEC family transporter n=1 Tax=Thermomonas mangrovi TaxID=2993316 RepID=UPI0023072E0A|nr:AEC family transporter [Thermomonas mangrovi]
MAVDAFALVLAMLALGALFARLRLLPGNAADALNMVVLHVCLPAAVLRYVPRLHWDPALAAVVATPWLLALVAIVLVSALARGLRFRRDEAAVVLLCVALGNTSFIGYPLVQALLGEDALPHAVVYDQLGTFLLLSTFGLYVVARYAGDAPPDARTMALRMLRFPPLWALAIALVAMPAQPPAWLDAMLQRLADALLPLAMLAVGLALKLKLPRDELAPLAVGLGLKLVAMPLLAFAGVAAIGMASPAREVVVLESGMPAMISAAALAGAHGLAPRLAAALVGYGILLAMATLPAWRWILHIA